MVSPLVRPPHANSFPGGVQRSPMGPPMSPNLSGGLMPHPRPQHPPRGPSGPPLVPRGTQAALKAEQDLKVSVVNTFINVKGFFFLFSLFFFFSFHDDFTALVLNQGGLT